MRFMLKAQLGPRQDAPAHPGHTLAPFNILEEEIEPGIELANTCPSVRTHDEACPRRPIDDPGHCGVGGEVTELAHPPVRVDNASAAPDGSRGQVENHWSHHIEWFRRSGSNSLKEVGRDNGVVVEHHKRIDVCVAGEVVEAKVAAACTTEVASGMQDDRWKAADVLVARGVEWLLPVLDKNNDIGVVIAECERSKTARREGVLIEIHDHHAYTCHHGEMTASAPTMAAGDVTGTPISQSGKQAIPCFWHRYWMLRALPCS